MVRNAERRRPIKPDQIKFKDVNLKCPECYRWHRVSNVVLFAAFTEQIKVEDPCRCQKYTFTIDSSMPLPDQDSFDKINEEKNRWSNEVSL